MMKCVVLVALLACAWAAPKDAVNPASQPLQVSEVVSQAQKHINDLATSIKDQLNIPDQEAVVRTIKDQSTNLVTNLQSLITSVSEEVIIFAACFLGHESVWFFDFQCCLSGYGLYDFRRVCVAERAGFTRARKIGLRNYCFLRATVSHYGYSTLAVAWKLHVFLYIYFDIQFFMGRIINEIFLQVNQFEQLTRFQLRKYFSFKIRLLIVK